MLGFRTKIKQLTSGNVPYGEVLIADGLSGFTFSNVSGLTTVIGKGTSFPVSPSGGTLYYRTDVDLLFYYDNSRSKWLTVEEHSLTCGRATVTAGGTTYMRVGDATQSSVVGFRMIRNGTIMGASINNSNSLTATRNIEIRINNSSVNKVTINMLTGFTGTDLNNANMDFSIGDLIQVVAVASVTGAALSDAMVVVDIAYRI